MKLQKNGILGNDERVCHHARLPGTPLLANQIDMPTAHRGGVPSDSCLRPAKEFICFLAAVPVLSREFYSGSLQLRD
jgi:hypothetical protein